MANFPAIKPTSRNFTLPTYPVKRFTAINGAGSTRLYGSKAFDAELDLHFIIDDDTLLLVINRWNNAYRSYDPHVLPSEVFS